jgi:uncharacterized protein (UPF0276 family)
MKGELHMPGTRKEVAEAIMALSYIEMMELSEAFADSLKEDRDSDIMVDLTNRDVVADRFRWWAEGYLDALESEREEVAQ